MKAIGRLYQYFDFKHIKPTRFEKDFGLSNGYFGVQLKREADIGSGILQVIIDNCRDLNIEWLISGKGQMIKEIEIHKVEEPEEEYKTSISSCEQCKIKDELIKSLEREIDTQGQFIKHLVESDLKPTEDTKKRGVTSSGYGNSKLSEAI